MDEHPNIPPDKGRRRSRRVLVIGFSVLFGLVALGAWLGPELWARSWEAKWRDFRTEWEAKGEDFGVETHLPPPVPDEENVAMHPWLRRLATDDPELQKRIEAMDPDKVPGMKGWKYRNDDEESLADQLGNDPELTARLRRHLDEFAPELAAFSEAMSRPKLVTPIDLDEGFDKMEFPWMKWFKMTDAIQCRASLAMADGDGAAVTSDAVMLICFGNHLRHDPFIMGQVIGAGIEQTAFELVEEALDRKILGNVERERLVRAMKRECPPIEEAVAQALRMDRGYSLQEIDRIEANLSREIKFADDLSPPMHLVRRAVMSRVYFARSRLSVCEDMQRQLFASESEVLKTIRLEDVPRYEAALDERFTKKDRLFETLAGTNRLFGFPSSFVERLEQSNEKRQALLSRLRE